MADEQCYSCSLVIMTERCCQSFFLKILQTPDWFGKLDHISQTCQNAFRKLRYTPWSFNTLLGVWICGWNLDLLGEFVTSPMKLSSLLQDANNLFQICQTTGNKQCGCILMSAWWTDLSGLACRSVAICVFLDAQNDVGGQWTVASRAAVHGLEQFG